MKKLLLLIITLTATSASLAQVGIGTTSPNNDAILELSSSTKGLLLPRVALISTTSFAPLSAHTLGMSVFNTATAGDVTPGTYYNDGTKWIRIEKSSAATKSFYMPPVAIDVSVAATGLTLDMYTLYKNQFNTPAYKSTSAPASVPFFTAATDLYYYVTSYDTNAMTITNIDDNGVMTYNVSGLGSSSCSLLNIVFVYK
jgi:hypothetical protein